MEIIKKLRPTRIRDIKMKQWVKIMIWVAVTIIGIVIIGYGGFRGCKSLIDAAFESNSCERFNIDNIETRTRIDIPSSICGEPECFSCILDKAANTKTNYFRIRTDVEDMDRYVERNSFISVYEADMDLSVFGELAKKPEIKPDNMRNIYYNSGKGNRTDWLAILDKNSGDLWVYMKYKD